MHNEPPAKSRGKSRESCFDSGLGYLLNENRRGCFSSVSVVTSTAAAKQNNNQLMQHAWVSFHRPVIKRKHSN